MKTMSDTNEYPCPRCASRAVETDSEVYKQKKIRIHSCQDCGREWQSAIKEEQIIKGWINKYRNAPNEHLDEHKLDSCIHVHQTSPDAIEVEGFQCLNCGHVYMEVNTSECDCTVGRYDFKRVRCIIMEVAE